MRALIFILALSFLSLSVHAGNLTETDSHDSTTLELREALLGTWFNRYTQSDNGYKEEFLTISKNGTFRLRFVVTNGLGQLKDAYSIAGIWGVADGILFTSNIKYVYLHDVEFPAYLGDAHEFNAYRIVGVDGSFLRYQPLGKDVQASLERINRDPCDSRDEKVVVCGDHARILDPVGSNSGNEISLAE